MFSCLVWVGCYESGAMVVVRCFGSTGELPNAQFGRLEDGGMSGVEYGTAPANEVDQRGFELAPTFKARHPMAPGGCPI